MNTKRSYLDSLNAGRQRRPGTSLDEISRTLEDIESRLERVAQARAEREKGESDIARRMEALSRRASRDSESPRPALQKLALALDDNRRKEDELAFASRIVDELKALRTEIGEMVSSGFRREFESLRKEIVRHPGSAAPSSRENRPEGWRNSAAWASAPAPQYDDPTLEGLARRLEQINDAVNSLPESLSLRSLEDKVRTLATALEQVVEQQRLSPDLNSLINERLDEISRAIAASASSAKTPPFDPAPFERIEARISSLAQQIAELAEEDRSAGVGEHLARLSQRIDEIARRAGVPEDAVERLAGQIAAISQKLDATFRPDTETVVRGLDDRFADLAEMIERSRDNAAEEGRSLFRGLEGRLNALSEKLARQETGGGAEIIAAIDARFAELSARLEEGLREPADAEALRTLEARLEDVAVRLQNASEQMGIDGEVIARLEAQVASLSDHLAHPGLRLPEFEDIGPRLEHLERVVAENREALFEAARRAAEEAIARLDLSQMGASDAELAQEIRALEALARKSDERNTKTFEAIHDTLLKIVDRLAVLEAGGDAAFDYTDTNDGSEAAPASESQVDEEEIPNAGAAKRSPAEAAAAAAEAALSGEDADTTAAPAKRSVLGGLARALGTRGREQGVEERREPAMDAGESDVEEGPSLEDINEPLEPGSGAPDLNAIMRRVRDERSPRVASEAETARSDFIAAARRAAQAAAAEAEIMKKKSSDAGSTSRRLGLGQILRGRRKAALMAVAGFIVIAGGVYAVRTVLTDDMLPFIAEAPAKVSSDMAEADPASEAADDSAPIAAVDRDAPAAAAVAAAADAADSAAVDADERQPAAEFGADAASSEGEHMDKPAAEEHVPEEGAADPGSTGAVENGEATGASESEVPNGQERADVQASAAGAPDVQTAHRQVLKTEKVTLADIPAEVGPVALRQAAADGDAKAMFEIASRYADGRGVESDMAEAAEWYLKAAERGLAPAQYRIGNMLEKGLGVERDIDKARMWYKRAAEQGNASAMHNLGVLYAMGADGKTDNEEAARWFRKAAQLGIADSQFNLGILSAKGAGVPQDLEEAYKWFALVAKAGDSDAAAKRDEIAKALDPEALENAKTKAELWKPKTLDRDANFVDIPPEWNTDKTTTASVDMNKAIANIQVILNKNGYEAGPIDGVMGEKTRAAIAAFQKDNGMKPTGQIDDALVHALLNKK